MQMGGMDDLGLRWTLNDLHNVVGRAYIAFDSSRDEIWLDQPQQRQRVPTLHFIFRALLMWVAYGENGQNGKFKPPPHGPKHRGGP